jgi:adenine-specific DNA-methyltransferase
VEKLRTHSPDLTERNLDALAGLFPAVITEARDADGRPVRAVDLDRLRQELSGRVVEGPRERYLLDWPGRREALLAANAPVARALRPVRAESVGFDTAPHLFIEGDNLDVLKLLQESYRGKVKLIYIDPPYNTGSDFVYHDDFAATAAEYLARSGQSDQDGRRLVARAESGGRLHSDWLSMMYPRLKLARNLLADDGAIFVSIDATEQANLTRLLAEVMGEDNFRASIVWQKRYTRSNNTRDFTAVTENIVVFARSERFTVNLLPRTAAADARYANPDSDPRGAWKGASFLNPASAAQRPNLCYEIQNPNTGQRTWPSSNAWRRSRSEFDRLAADGRLYWGADGTSPVPSVKMFLSEARGLTPTNFWSHEYAGSTDDGTRDLAALLDGRVFDNPKPVRLMRRVLEHATDPGSLVLDFFAGSGTMAQAVLELNAADGGTRRFIAIQLAEECPPRSPAAAAGLRTVADIGKERIRRAGQLVSGGPHHPRWDGETGFRVLRVDSSSLSGVLRPPDQTSQADLALLAATVKPGRTPEDLLFEVLVGAGISPAAPVTADRIEGCEVFTVDGGALVACLAGDVTLTVLRAIARRSPSRAVFLDAGFGTDTDRINADRVFARLSPGTEVSVI